MTYSNPFLAEIEDERTREAIASGNLIRHRKPPEVWTLRAYKARILKSVCSCGESYNHLIGIFTLEISSQNSTRETALDLSRSLSIPEKDIITETTLRKTTRCPSCLPFNPPTL